MGMSNACRGGKQKRCQNVVFFAERMAFFKAQPLFCGLFVNFFCIFAIP
jgi:hypothetical protein